MNSIGKNIRALRQQNGWSQNDVGKRLGISIPAVSKIESGNTDINMSRVDQIAQVFGVTSQDIISHGEGSTNTDSAVIIEDLKRRIHDKDLEINELQIKLIALYEELRG